MMNVEDYVYYQKLEDKCKQLDQQVSSLEQQIAVLNAKVNKLEAEKKKLKFRKLYRVILIIIGICLIGCGYCLYEIWNWHQDNITTDAQISQINETTAVKEVADSTETLVINNDSTTTISDETGATIENKANPYWDYIKMNLIDVNMDELKEKNADTVGWIQVNGTNINYPFVQTDDNSYYLAHSFDKSRNNAGWVFLDYRNNINNLDKNSIIYAHGRVDETMFGSLKNILTNSWLDNTDNYVVKMSTEKANTLWQVFSVYHLPTTSDYLQINFYDSNDYGDFISLLKNRSMYNFNTEVSTDDKILTLSTCYNNYEKMVMHAKLIKIDSK